jgi:hypothetical protein
VRWGTVDAVEPGHSDRPTILPGGRMTNESRGQQLKPGQVPKPGAKDPDKPKEKSEAAEVAGRHKNSGQKDHKGAR